MYRERKTPVPRQRPGSQSSPASAGDGNLSQKMWPGTPLLKKGVRDCELLYKMVNKPSYKDGVAGAGLAKVEHAGRLAGFGEARTRCLRRALWIARGAIHPPSFASAPKPVKRPGNPGVARVVRSETNPAPAIPSLKDSNSNLRTTKQVIYQQPRPHKPTLHPFLRRSW